MRNRTVKPLRLGALDDGIPWRNGAFIYLAEAPTTASPVAGIAMIYDYLHQQGQQPLRNRAAWRRAEIHVENGGEELKDFQEHFPVSLGGSTDIQLLLCKRGHPLVLKTDKMSNNTLTLKRLGV